MTNYIRDMEWKIRRMKRELALAESQLKNMKDAAGVLARKRPESTP